MGKVVVVGEGEAQVVGVAAGMTFMTTSDGAMVGEVVAETVTLARPIVMEGLTVGLGSKKTSWSIEVGKLHGVTIVESTEGFVVGEAEDVMGGVASESK